MGKRAQRHLFLGLCAAVCAAAAAWTFEASAQVRGHAIFEGQAEVRAHIQGHDATLPAAASRCANCHAGETPLGEALNATRLMQPQARRGGPPSHYDEASFCRVLRDGIDPAWVQLPREMPRYALSDDDCRALWRHVTRARS